MEDANFPEWMRRVRTGDPDAVAEFVGRFGPQIRRAIRVRGTGGRLQRILDSEDLCQTVMRRFFEHTDDASTPAEDPAMLLNWLLEVARNRLREQHRRDRAKKRGGGRLREVDPAVLDQLAGDESDIDGRAADRELLAFLMERMTPEQRRVAERRADGDDWADIARDHGTTPEAMRKRYRRGLDAIVNESDWGAI
jgi:RNA polymerase sigma factor (sigma-70 family)